MIIHAKLNYVTENISDKNPYLVLVEHVIGNVNNLLYVDDAANALNVHIRQHCKYQDPLDQQLSIFRLRDTVQHPFHVYRKLNLTRGHLERGRDTANISESDERKWRKDFKDTFKDPKPLL